MHACAALPGMMQDWRVLARLSAAASYKPTSTAKPISQLNIMNTQLQVTPLEAPCQRHTWGASYTAQLLQHHGSATLKGFSQSQASRIWR
jgi:hypothetical protein